MKNDMMSAHLWEERQQESVCLRKSREETLEEGLERRECLQQKKKKKHMRNQASGPRFPLSSEWVWKRAADKCVNYSS